MSAPLAPRERMSSSGKVICLSTFSGACVVVYPSLDLFFILSGMISLAAPVFLPIQLRAPDDQAV